VLADCGLLKSSLAVDSVLETKRHLESTVQELHTAWRQRSSNHMAHVHVRT
jgi:hypothetical protein